MTLHLKVSIIISALAALAACTSGKTKPVQTYGRACEPTPVQIQDMSQFNVTSAPGKVTVIRVLRSSCPYCREDLQQMGLMFKIGKWSTDRIQLVLISYRKEGVESRASFDTFVRTELNKTGFPIEAAQIIFLDRTYPDLLKAKAKSGDLMFDGWRAVPYSLIFAKDGRLAYRGHFTMIPSQQSRHYDFITELQDESCR